MKQSRANYEEVWTALHRTIPFSLCYSLPAVSLTKEECSYIFAPIVKTGLPLTGVVATIPIAIRSSSVLLGGLGIVDPYVHMGVSHIEALVTHHWKGTPTGKLLDIALDDLALELGLSHPWQQDQLKRGLPYASTSSWIKHTFQFALDHDIHIKIGNPQFTPNREHECTIMETALSSVGNVKMLKAINRVRMALKVLWLSDIMTADGRYIDRRWLKPMDFPPCQNDY